MVCFYLLKNLDPKSLEMIGYLSFLGEMIEKFNDLMNFKRNRCHRNELDSKLKSERPVFSVTDFIRHACISEELVTEIIQVIFLHVPNVINCDISVSVLNVRTERPKVWSTA